MTAKILNEWGDRYAPLNVIINAQPANAFMK